ncbi:unnamed protein product, partial [Meganyctiphanes norvegica]
QSGFCLGHRMMLQNIIAPLLLVVVYGALHVVAKPSEKIEGPLIKKFGHEEISRQKRGIWDLIKDTIKDEIKEEVGEAVDKIDTIRDIFRGSEQIDTAGVDGTKPEPAAPVHQAPVNPAPVHPAPVHTAPWHTAPVHPIAPIPEYPAEANIPASPTYCGVADVRSGAGLSQDTSVGCANQYDCPYNMDCICLKCVDPCVNRCAPTAECQVYNRKPICTCPHNQTGNPDVFCNNIVSGDAFINSVDVRSGA